MPPPSPSSIAGICFYDPVYPTLSTPASYVFQPLHLFSQPSYLCNPYRFSLTSCIISQPLHLLSSFNPTQPLFYTTLLSHPLPVSLNTYTFSIWPYSSLSLYISFLSPKRFFSTLTLPFTSLEANTSTPGPSLNTTPSPSGSTLLSQPLQLPPQSYIFPLKARNFIFHSLHPALVTPTSSSLHFLILFLRHPRSPPHTSLITCVLLLSLLPSTHSTSTLYSTPSILVFQPLHFLAHPLHPRFFILFLV